MLVKRIICTSFLIIWMIVIFMFSNEAGAESKNTSESFAGAIIEKIDSDITLEEKEKLIEETSFITRKFAHFTIFLVLGVLSYLTFKVYNLRKTFLISIIFCLLYAISDEIHQMFVVDRAARIMDVGIDFVGSMIGVLIIYLFGKILFKNKVIN